MPPLLSEDCMPSPVVELGFSTKRCIKAMTVTKVGAPLVDPRDIKHAIENVVVNCGNEIPLLNDMQPVKDSPCAVVGGGQWDFDEVNSYDTIFAVGKRAGERLNAAGREPDFLIITGHGQKWPLPQAKHYFIAAMCDPHLLKIYPTTMFHAVIDGYGQHFNPKGQSKIPGGIAAGLTGMNLVYVMGYRELHLFGYDSSGEGDIVIDVGGERFTTTFSLFQQAANFTKAAQIISNKGVRVLVHGNGLLPSIIRGIYEEDDSPPDEAIYSLMAMGSSFDFVTWMINAEMYRRRHNCPNPLRVKFLYEGLARDVDEISVNQGEYAHRGQMLTHVIRPAMKMLGVVEDDTMVVNQRNFDCYYIDIAKNFRNGEKVPKFKRPNVERSKNLIVITLREASYLPERNSNLPALVEFAKKRQAEGYEILFVRDTARAHDPIEGFKTHPEAAIDLEVRHEVYCQAFCNVSIATGPTSLMMFSDNPFLIFVPIDKFPGYDPWTTEWTKVACGTDVKTSDQHAWFNHDQRFAWVDDTEENIEAAWQKWLAYSAMEKAA